MALTRWIVHVMMCMARQHVKPHCFQSIQFPKCISPCIDLQKDFALVRCAWCGMVYAPGDAGDERLHAATHAASQGVLKFQVCFNFSLRRDAQRMGHLAGICGRKEGGLVGTGMTGNLNMCEHSQGKLT